MVEPISPCDLKLFIPDFIITAVNQLISEKWDGEEAFIKQNEILNIVCTSEKDDGKPTREEVFKRHWLDIEDTYRNAGWYVDYSKPGYNESYEAYFVFKPKK